MFRADGYSELFHGFQLALEVSGLRPSTINHYTSDGRKFLESYPDVPPSEITSIHIRQYLALLKKTVKRVRIALRTRQNIFGGFLRFPIQTQTTKGY